MRSDAVRVLLVADTHLGFDLPFRPRVQRRRRGHDFFANFDRALAPALMGDVDLVVHGGDLFYRSKVPAALVDMAMAPLVKVADAGTPVYIVPGNHERSTIPLHLWTAHPNLHIFDRPRTFLWSGSQGSIALAGFPFSRKVAPLFAELVGQTGYAGASGVPRLLCLHQTVEGAQVGVQNYTFRRGIDIVPGPAIPPGFSVVLSGHIHRAQTLTRDLQGQPLAAPVVYPGSIERTSFAERDEEKGYVVLTIGLAGARQGQLVENEFVPLPARPMVTIVLDSKDGSGQPLEDQLRQQLDELEPDSVVRVEVVGARVSAAWQTLTASLLRELAPASMNISLAGGWARDGRRQ